MEVYKVTDLYLKLYAKDGLRTLLLAEWNLDLETYLAWEKKYYEASISLEGREEKIDEVAEEIESNLTLLGSTAIEDLLQDQVGETLVALKEAGIKIWVLTGDKIETVISIGYSCQLLSNEMV